MKNIDKTREQLLKEIDQLKANNAELEENDEIFQLIAETTSDNIAITTFDGKNEPPDHFTPISVDRVNALVS